MSTLLIKNGTVVTLGEENRVIDGGAVLVEGAAIKQVGPAAEFTDSYDRVIDASNKVVLPGFINAHMHFYSTMVRGLGKAEPAVDFVDVLKKLWWRLDKQLVLDDCYYSALVPLIDAVKKADLILHMSITLVIKIGVTIVVKSPADMYVALAKPLSVALVPWFTVIAFNGKIIPQPIPDINMSIAIWK